MNRAGEIIQHESPDLVFAYRQSSLDELVILEAESSWSPRIPRSCPKLHAKAVDRPQGGPSLAHQYAGRFSESRAGMSAGMPIDQAGLKGHRVGGAEVSDRHANFIVADPILPEPGRDRVDRTHSGTRPRSPRSRVGNGYRDLVKDRSSAPAGLIDPTALAVAGGYLRARPDATLTRTINDSMRGNAF